MTSKLKEVALLPWFWENRGEYESRYAAKRSSQRTPIMSEREVRVYELEEDRYIEETNSILVKEKDKLFRGTEKWIILCVRNQYLLLHEYQYLVLTQSGDTKNIHIHINQFDRITPIQNPTASTPVRNTPPIVTATVASATAITNMQIQMERVFRMLREQAGELKEHKGIISEQANEIDTLKKTIEGLKRDHESMIARVASCETQLRVAENEMGDGGDNEESSATGITCGECGETKSPTAFRLKPSCKGEKEKRSFLCNACRVRLYRVQKKSKLNEAV